MAKKQTKRKRTTTTKPKADPTPASLSKRQDAIEKRLAEFEERLGEREKDVDQFPTVIRREALKALVALLDTAADTAENLIEETQPKK